MNKFNDAKRQAEYDKWLEDIKSLLKPYPLHKLGKHNASDAILRSYFVRYRYSAKEAAKLILLNA